MKRKFRVRLMRVIIPKLWNVCLYAETVEASAPNEAIQMATELLSRAGTKAGLFVTATLEK